MYKKRKSGLTKIMACERRARNIFFSVVASLHSFEYLSRSITSFKPRSQVRPVRLLRGVSAARAVSWPA